MRPSRRPDFCGRNFQSGAASLAIIFGIELALATGASIGVAGIDDHRARHAALDAFDAKPHRRGADLVGGKSSGDGGRRLRNQQGQIAFEALYWNLCPCRGV
jgi:hypothetical protein